MITAKMRPAKRSGITISRILTAYERSGGLCGICGQSVSPTAATLDHIIPLSRGGADDDGNLQLAHAVCNRAKSGMLPEEYAARIARRENTEAQKRPRNVESADVTADPNDLSNWITLKEASEEFSASLAMLRKAVERKTIPAELIGGERRGVWLVQRSDVAAYIAAHRPRGAKEGE